MRPQDIIKKKRDGGALSVEEIRYFVNGVAAGEIVDYQASALLMAVFHHGMNEAEQHALTDAMLRSGALLDFSDIDRPKADKHSTGGVGDKTSLIIAPLAAACGLAVPMISGRGLGHTGGTLDKLESIPGYRVGLSKDEFRTILRRIGFAMSGQTSDIAPADKKLYALRDATSTVEAIPLIVASIMSKKLAADLDALVLDVKTGSGAFMKEEEKSRKLAHELVRTGNAFGVRTQALLTDMNQPLGYSVGNALEVLECIKILRGEMDDRARPVLDLSLDLTARMVHSAGLKSSLEDARAIVDDALHSGRGLESFKANVEAQGGDPSVCDQPERVLDLSARPVKLEAPHAGYVSRIDATEVGHAVAVAGGGRIRMEDKIDPAVGFTAEVKLGDEVKAGDVLGILYVRENKKAYEALERIKQAYTIAEEPPQSGVKLIKEVIAE